MKVFISTTDTENYRWIDTRFDLKDVKAGFKLYGEQHVAGAIYWDLEKDLSDMAVEAGRHPMPSDEKLTELVRSAGLDLGDQVVVYDQGGSPFAARAWWLLKYCGFENVHISSLGFEELKQQGIELSSDIPNYQRTQTKLKPQKEIYADRQYVKNLTAGKELGVLLDARSPERYAGIEEPVDAVAGRIPGAKNYDWSQLVKDNQFYSEVDFSEVLQPHEPAVVYCGSGVTAAPLFAMLAEKGYTDIRLYTGSYSDWITDPENLVEFDRDEHPEAADDDTKAILARLIEEGYTGEMLMKKFEYEKALLENKQ